MDDSYKLKKLIKDLEGRRGRHTELISLYIPKDYSLNEINNLLSSEISLTENVKSKQVRNNVTDALNKISQQLKLYKKTPPNGLAIFCGNVSEQEGKTDVKIWVVEPPQAINIKLYWCDQTFELAHLRDMVKEKEVYGLLIMDTKEATFGFLQGKSIKVLRRLDSIVPGKVGKGGQCIAFDSKVLSDREMSVCDIKKNDIIKAYDFKNRKIIDTKCKKIMKRKSDEAYEIRTKNKKLIVTEEHLIFTGNSEKFVKDLQLGDKLFVLNDKFEEEEIIQISKIKSSVDFYDLFIPVCNNFFANGILVHNSQQRFERVREGLINDFYKKIAENVKSFFSIDIKGLIIGGPGPSKYNFYDGGYLEFDMKKKVIGIKDIGYTDEPGLNELVEKSGDILAESAVSKERELVQKFVTELQKDSGMVAYGIKPVLHALEAGAVKIVIITEDLEYSEIEYQCSCGESGVMFVRNDELDKAVCKKCGQKINPMGMRDIMEAFDDLAKKYGTEVEIISRSTREGEQLYQLGGIGAILRYKL